jgi:hypothetical protein
LGEFQKPSEGELPLRVRDFCVKPPEIYRSNPRFDKFAPLAFCEIM